MQFYIFSIFVFSGKQRRQVNAVLISKIPYNAPRDLSLPNQEAATAGVL